MKIIIHADDYGLSRGITDNILHCIDEGVISSVSLMANGYAVDYAIEEYKKRANLKLACHLNFFEGKPINHPGEVNLLVDQNGYFRHSFLSIWKAYVLSTKKERALLKQQIQMEMSAQIEIVRSKIGIDAPVNIDSHIHFHMIPFIFEALLELRGKYNFSYIRMPEEPFFFQYDKDISIENYFGPNIIKHYLLNSLSRKYKKILSRVGIDYCDYFVGLLHTGKMSGSVVKSALSNIPANSNRATVEILFHPGGAYNTEETLWQNNKILLKYYFSPWRKYEQKELTSKELLNILGDYKK